MRPGIFAKTFPGADPDTVLRAVAAAGYSTAHWNWACAGLSSIPDTIPDGLSRQVRDAADAAGVDIVGVSATWNMIHPDPAVRAAGQHGLRVIAAECDTLGTDLVTLCTGTRDPDDQWRAHEGNTTSAAWSDLRAELDKALGTAEAHGIRLGIEPELANVVRDARSARRLLDEVADDRLAIVIDPANLFETAEPDEGRRLVTGAVDLLGGRIAMAHAKDRDATGAVVPAGQGVVDWDHYVAALRQAGFDGPLVTHGLTAAEAPAVARFLSGRLA